MKVARPSFIQWRRDDLARLIRERRNAVHVPPLHTPHILIGWMQRGSAIEALASSALARAVRDHHADELHDARQEGRSDAY